MTAFALSRVAWRPCFRIVPSRFPPVQLFERVGDPADWEALAELELLTNPRLRDAIGEIALVPPEDRIAGPGASPVMAAFTHLNPAGSRFSDGTFGVYYAARDEQTAIRETVFHRERFLADSSQPPQMLEMRAYLADVSGTFRDLRGHRDRLGYLDPASYAVSQPFGRQLRERGENGIVYPSVRNPGGECVAVMRARTLTPARQGRHYGYRWDGARVREVIELRATGFHPG